MAQPNETVSERNTTTTTTTTSGGAGMGFVIGALVVVVGLLAYVVFGPGIGGTSGGADINVTVEGAAEGAADAVEGGADAVEDGAEASDG